MKSHKDPETPDGMGVSKTRASGRGPWGMILFALCCVGEIMAQTSGIRTYCNPLDIDYQYNFEQSNEGISYRSGADPVLINHQGEYYLFGTIAQGWWHSGDLATWHHVTPDKWSVRGVVAPAALSVIDTLYLLPSTYDRLPIFYATAPKTGHLEYFNRLMPFMPETRGPWDPAFFMTRIATCGIFITAHQTSIRFMVSSSTIAGDYHMTVHRRNSSGYTRTSMAGSDSDRTTAEPSIRFSKGPG